MTNQEDATQVVTEEITSMLDELGRGRDADVVETLLSTESSAGEVDHIAGIPAVAMGGAVTVVVGWFLTVVQSLVEKAWGKAIEKAGEKAGERVAEKGADRALSWLQKKLDKSPEAKLYKVSGRLETVAEIAKTLEGKGWPPDLVGKTADELWKRSEIVARRLSPKDA